MTAKKKFHIALLPEIHDILRRMAFERGECLGDTIAFLADHPLVEVHCALPVPEDLSDYLMRGYKEPSGIPNLSDMRIISDDEYGCPSCSQTFDDVEKCREHIRKEHGGK